MSTNKLDVCIFKNGKIFTANPDQPHANAMVTKNGMIEWIGDKENLDKIDGEVIDLQGRRVLPGFIDAHLHPLFLANASKQIACTPPIVNSIEDLKKQIHSLRESKSKDEWI